MESPLSQLSSSKRLPKTNKHTIKQKQSRDSEFDRFTVPDSSVSQPKMKSLTAIVS